MDEPWKSWLAEPLPRVVADDDAVGGRIRVRDEDFLVEEIPAYEPSGDGEHLFLWIEKKGKNTQDVVRALAKLLSISDQDVGTAGMKDRNAVTRQYVSVPWAAARARLAQGGGLAKPSDVSLGEDIHVLSAGLHGNRLKTGHLHGNRFEIRIRDVHPEAAVRVPRAAERIEAHGIPNFYGEQRFGWDGQTVQLGLELLLKRDDGRRVRRNLLRLALSSVQSVLFNRVLLERLSDRLLHQVIEGDLMQVAPAGGFFTVEDVARERSRLEQGEILLTGPMFGRKMRGPNGPAADREARILDQAGLTPEAFHGHGKLLLGARRPLLVRPRNLKALVDDEGVLVSFELPAGAYATIVLREFMGETPASGRTEQTSAPDGE
ncbi:MAG: tRNA pseudouridine(13) synthase TruD [Candidatus Eisenbacteria bacterium]